jgi:multidrug transporter EmrE-like cation transporter
MVFIILSIISSSLIYITFKLLGRYKVAIFPAIITNYIAASFTGYLLREKDFSLNEVVAADWFYTSIIIGILFITMFYLIGLSTQKAGITITSISTKMSVIFPMLFSIIYYQENIYAIKIVGMILALVSIFLSTIQDKTDGTPTKSLLFPLVLFFGMGIVDSTVKFNQEEYLLNTGVIESTTVIFAVSAIIGLFIQFTFNIKKIKKLKISTIILGVILGLSNFGSLYFLILALNSNFLDSSVIFAVNNTAIILISVLIGRFFFEEKLSKLNWLGVAISIIAILSLSM